MPLESQLTSGELTCVDVDHVPVFCTFLNAKHSTRDLIRDSADTQEEDCLSKTYNNGSSCVCACLRNPTHTPAQNLVLIVLQVPGEITSNQERCLSLRVVTPCNMTEFPLSNATPPRGNSSCASPLIFLEHAGTAAVKLQAQAQVSPQNKSPMSCEKGNGEPSLDARAELTWQPSTAEGPVPRPASNGERVFRMHNQCRWKRSEKHCGLLNGFLLPLLFTVMMYCLEKIVLGRFCHI